MSAALQLPPDNLPIPIPATDVLAIAREWIDASRLDGAERLLQHVLAVAPTHPEALHLAGYIAFKRNRYEDAADLMERAMAAGARAPRQLCNVAEVYRLVGRLDEGMTVIRRAQALAPTDPVAHFNEAMLRYERMEAAECIRAARRAIALKPDMPEGHMRLGQTLLLTGAMQEGWEEYEWRYQIAGAQPLMPKTDQPQWDGRPLGAGQRLVLVADQGYGDVIMFARYLPWAMSRAQEISVACSGEMLGLLQRHWPGPHYFMRWDDCPPFACYCPFSGLPRLHGTRLDTIPATPMPYLQPDPALVAKWRERLRGATAPGALRVALAWAGRPTHNNDRNRSMTLVSLAPLAEVPGAAFVAVQKGPSVAQAAGWPGPAPLVTLDAELQTFEDTAAVLANVDLLVCVDTSVGHLAGAMGRTAWVLMPFAPDWRWLERREDTPWYPSLRLIRQAQPQDWGDVVARVASDLRALAAERV